MFANGNLPYPVFAKILLHPESGSNKWDVATKSDFRTKQRRYSKPVYAHFRRV
ncbi:hypothetical protein BDE36_0898 [Arcticibacter tournemirensis]|nr:hypothetical protein BDE36_0898 [Arcticibacter tournemirensis]